ncbi:MULTISPECIES: nuclease-related domain-containing DEAD/DEAH box helicase [Dickeya]|uniref:nuclease-related domain-containing DEAD/DEAH box helicase n=1 Tax=Dickeya TaxID=204037 RepID=UPI0006765542|nr:MULTISPECIES: AAA family ATPase [Dickeya]UGA53211.1 AAA family ATPase [Dickeya fangzhongdai]
MIPSFGPQVTESYGEVILYRLIETQLSDDFTVIHSLPWLCSAVKEIDPQFAPTGEIDFLIIHKELGVLALEVKSGRYRVDGVTFLHLSTGKKTSPIQQTRHNVHGLARWLGGNQELRLRIGYGLIFPDSDFADQIINAALVDISTTPHKSIAIDMGQLPSLGKRIVEIMNYWKEALSIPAMSDAKKQKLISTLCPKYDGTPKWGTRVFFDNKIWLPLTNEQNEVVITACNNPRMVITGWPGTGKTLIGITIAREMVKRGMRVLVLTFNNLLAEYLTRQLDFDQTACTVSTWHRLCAIARRQLDTNNEQASEDWYKTGCLDDIKMAIKQGMSENYDVLVIDECQALHPEWCKCLVEWFSEKKIIAFCDETQKFPFESGINLQQLCRLLEVEFPFLLTIALRMPKAVTERLLSVRKISYQLHSIRDKEPGTLREIIPGPEWSLKDLIENLITEGVRKEDIVALYKFSLPLTYEIILLEFDIRTESISRYRGLESPIVIILDAESMVDAELFCAYSRSTTLAIALYNPSLMGGKSAGKFQEQLLTIEGNNEKIEAYHIASLVSNIMRVHLGFKPFDIKCINLGWHKAWGVWLVELNDLNSYESLWLDYLVSNFKHPIFYWDKKSRFNFYCYNFNDNVQDNSEYITLIELKKCNKCNVVSPFMLGLKSECMLCNKNTSDFYKDITLGTIEGIMKYDKTILMEKSSVPIGRLPYSLAAFGARRYAEIKNPETQRDFELPHGRFLYRAALAFVQSRIIYLPKGADIVAPELATDLYDRYDDIQQSISLPQWKSIVANAFSTCYQKGLITKKSKGVYMIRIN